MTEPTASVVNEATLDIAAHVARLYLIVHGRPPDPGGLVTYIQHMRDGHTLEQLAAEFVAAAEFTNRIQSQDPGGRTVSQRARAMKPLRRPPPGYDGNLAGLVSTLLRDPAVQARLPLLPALYPEGVPLDSPEEYRIWLAQKTPHSTAAGGGGAQQHLSSRSSCCWTAQTRLG